jgi:hypothetical protein
MREYESAVELSAALPASMTAPFCKNFLRSIFPSGLLIEIRLLGDHNGFE